MWMNYEDDGLHWGVSPEVGAERDSMSIASGHRTLGPNRFGIFLN